MQPWTRDIAPPPKKKTFELGQYLSKHSVRDLQALIEAQGRYRARRADALGEAIVEERGRVRVQTLGDSLTVPLGKPALSVNSFLGVSR